jgi:predicted naringenin-chalcone synthase
MTAAILGLGTALPTTRLSRDVAEALTRAVACRTPRQTGVVAALYRQSGVETRHVCHDEAVIRDLIQGSAVSGSPFVPEPGSDGPTTAPRMRHYAEQALPLAAAAARRALDDTVLSPTAITHLVTVSCTGFAAPGVDVGLIKGLGLPPTTQRTHVGFMGCHGAINGLRAAAAFVASDPSARALVCAVELCSLHYHYGWDAQRLVANALFADGAAAVVVGPPPAGGPGVWSYRAGGSCLFPDSEDAMTWTVGDHGFAMTLSSRVPNLIRAGLRPWLEGWLASHGLTVDGVGSWAVHPGGPRILNEVEESLGLPAGAADVSREVLAECGNMSSPTVLFLLERLRRRGAAGPCVVLGFGPGLVAEVALLG